LVVSCGTVGALLSRVHAKLRQIGVNDLRVALMQQFIRLLDRILRTSVRTVAESIAAFEA
jgi:hypothetical protein